MKFHLTNFLSLAQSVDSLPFKIWNLALISLIGTCQRPHKDRLNLIGTNSFTS